MTRQHRRANYSNVNAAYLPGWNFWEAGLLKRRAGPESGRVHSNKSADRLARKLSCKRSSGAPLYQEHARLFGCACVNLELQTNAKLHLEHLASRIDVGKLDSPGSWITSL